MKVPLQIPPLEVLPEVSLGDPMEVSLRISPEVPREAPPGVLPEFSVGVPMEDPLGKSSEVLEKVTSEIYLLCLREVCPGVPLRVLPQVFSIIPPFLRKFPQELLRKF